jgi:hypothetical protein
MQIFNPILQEEIEIKHKQINHTLDDQHNEKHKKLKKNGLMRERGF